MVANSVFLRFSEVPERTQGVRLPLSWRARRADGWGWWMDPRVRRWRWAFSRFWPSKTDFSVHLGRETPQKRLSNGWRNGRVSAKVTASASPRGDQRSWGVALPSNQASRRSSPACVRVPQGPFSPTLYLKTRSTKDTQENIHKDDLLLARATRPTSLPSCSIARRGVTDVHVF
jgi:hypothetical protein